jgi:maleylacetoacetate isomerase
MKLYTYFRSSAAFRVRIALNVKGIGYEPSFVHLLKAEQSSPGYLKVNPIGLVPSLEDRGRDIAESLAIMEYLDETQPGPKLLPADPADRAYVRAFSQIIACEIHPLNNLRVLNHLRKAYGKNEDEVKEWYRHWIAEGFGMMESFLAKEKRSGRYTLGDQVTMADCCLVPQVYNAQRYKCDLSPYTTVMRINDACLALEAFKKALPEAQPDAS